MWPRSWTTGRVSERHVRGKWACSQCETLVQGPVAVVTETNDGGKDSLNPLGFLNTWTSPRSNLAISEFDVPRSMPKLIVLPWSTTGTESVYWLRPGPCRPHGRCWRLSRKSGSPPSTAWPHEGAASSDVVVLQLGNFAHERRHRVERLLQTRRYFLLPVLLGIV